jgi:hypothetical protein
VGASEFAFHLGFDCLSTFRELHMSYATIADTIGKTSLVQLVRLPDESMRERNNVILGKLEGNNPAGSVKDRAALSMRFPRNFVFHEVACKLD